MGMYDIVVIKCRNCGKETNSQTKILGENDMKILEIGSKIKNDKFNNCIFKLKNKCGCGAENAIKIRNGKIVSVEDPKKADVVEGLWKSYDYDDLKNLINLKLEKEK